MWKDYKSRKSHSFLGSEGGENMVIDNISIYARSRREHVDHLIKCHRNERNN
jgi:hypothetical protein